MIRKKIEIEKGSIAPVVRPLWGAAIEKLQEAELGLHQMTIAEDRVSFHQGWTRAVDSLYVFWSRFNDEGKSTFSKFQPWAGHRKRKHENIYLIKYLKAARHINQHGRFEFEWDDGKLLIAPDFNGHLKKLKIFPDGTFALEASRIQGSPVEAAVKYVGGYARLPQFACKLRGEKGPAETHHPPTVLDGDTVRSLSAFEAISQGIEYNLAILRDAFSKFAV